MAAMATAPLVALSPLAAAPAPSSARPAREGALVGKSPPLLSLHAPLSRPKRSSRALPFPCRAADGESSAPSTSPAPAGTADAAPKKKTVIRPVSKVQAPDANLELKALDDPSASVEGVVRLDKGAGLSLGQLALLVAGDAAGIVFFAWIGRATHVSTAVDFELLKTAFPFLTGWLVSSIVFGEYSPSRPIPQGFPSVAGSTAKPWALGIPLGIAIRSLLKGQAPQVPFMAVSMVSTAVILSAWRFAFFSLAAKGAGADGSAADRKGNAFEFFELLSSLVRRW